MADPEHRADIARRAVLIDLALDEIEIDPRAADGFGQRAAAQLIDAGGLNQLDKGGIGGDDFEIGVGHHEGIGHLLDQFEQRRRDRRAPLALRHQPHEQELPPILRETGNRNKHFARAAGEPDHRRADRIGH